MKIKPKAKRLVKELTDQLDLAPVDARRAAFAVLAVHEGWPKARIGRWLGISRARVGQRVAKYEKYAASRDDMPQLKAALASAKPVTRDTQRSVGFSQADWQDERFAVEMLNAVA